MVTVSAPKAPCRQTHTSVRVGHQGLMPAVDPPRRRCSQLAMASVRMSTPTPVAR